MAISWLNPQSNNFSLVTSTTQNVNLTFGATGRGAVIVLHWGSENDVTIGSVSLDTDTLAAGPQFWGTGELSQRSKFFYVKNITDTTQTLSIPYTNTSNSGTMGWAVLECTGHDTTTMYSGNSASEYVGDRTENLSCSANSGVVMLLQGGSPSSATAGGSSMTSFDCADGIQAAKLFYIADVGAAGTKALAWDASGYTMHGIEILAAGAGPAFKPAFAAHLLNNSIG
jgi:hypothetical protein